MSNTNKSVQSYKQARSLKFGFEKKRDCTICVAKTDPDQLCSDCSADLLLFFFIFIYNYFLFVFAYAVCWFLHAVTHIVM